jgi:glycosyltransferase involved in cell wall biosynthesis
MKIALCLLTRNEKVCLEVIYPQIPKPGPDAGFDAIYAIDGGSTDGTIEFFKQVGVPVLGQSKRGRGEAFLLAFQNIQADAYLFFSPDGNEAINDLKKFKPLLAQGNDLVIASRMMKGAFNEEDIHWFRPRKWANNFFNLLANFFFRKGQLFISDSINGYRAITAAAAKKLQLSASDYTIEYQMTMRALKHGLKIAEFPTHEGQRVAGETGAQSIPTGLRFVGRFFKELLGRD